MTPRLGEIWVYLAASPLLGLTTTLLAYQGACSLHQRCGGHPLANPVLLAVAALVALLWLTGTSYQTYFDVAQFVHFLLGPATVALAIPLYAQFDRLKRMPLPLIGALKIEDDAVRGFALGIALHGIGTARAFQESEQAVADGSQRSDDRLAAAGGDALGYRLVRCL